MSSNLRFASTLNDASHFPHSYSYSYPHNPTDRTPIPRRRKRPSHRSRERKSLIRHDDYADSISIALDQSIKLPDRVNTNKAAWGNRSNATVSPLLRRNFDQSWLRWKEKELAREREEREDVARREREQRRIFGGDVGEDDEMSLCPKMLEVVKFLFGGDVDFGYTDAIS